MRALITVCLILSTFSISNAQLIQILEAIRPKKAYEGIPILKKSSQVASIKIGAPNKLATYLDLGGLGSLLSLTSNSKSLGPILVDYEYFIKDHFGLGLTLSHASASETYKLLSISYSGEIKQYYIGASTYYHIYTTDKMDPYIKATAGINIWDATIKDANGNTTIDQALPTPFGFSSLIGMRYFVTKKLAVVGEGIATLSPDIKISANIGVAYILKE